MRANQPRPIWGEETVTVSVRMPRSTRDMLEEIAASNTRSRSAEIRALIVEALDARAGAVARSQRRPIQGHVV